MNVISGREQELWASRMGFLLAAIGSAVGLGNIWRFSYVAGQNGGASFLIIYLFCVLLIGLPIVIAELSMGRNTKGDAVQAFRDIRPNQPWYLVGGLAVIGCVFILGFYSVIAGWSLKYFVSGLSGHLSATEDYSHFFNTFIARPVEPIFWQAIMMVVTVSVVAAGIQKGIEAVNHFLMPLLALIVVILAAYSLTLDKAKPGLAFLFSPDWSAFTRPSVYIAAIGQAFFSLGVGMAIFLTYGAYLPREYAIPRAATIIVAGDTLLAILAGLAIFPAVFSFGLNPAEGPELAFIVLPKLFQLMPGGGWVSVLFFGLLVGAALTSMFSILEVPVAYFLRKTKLSRPLVSVGVGVATFAAGIPASLGYSVFESVSVAGRHILELYDYAISSFLLPVGGIATALFVGWSWDKTVALREADFNDSSAGRVWLFCLRFVAPTFIALAFLHTAYQTN